MNRTYRVDSKRKHPGRKVVAVILCTVLSVGALSGAVAAAASSLGP